MRIARKAAVVILTATIVAVPLALAPGWQAFDVTPKLLLLVGGACLTWLLAAIGGYDARLPRAIAWPLAGLALAGILATIFASDRVLAVAGSEWRRMGLPAWLACLALAAAVPTIAGNYRRSLLASLAAVGIVAAVYGLSQYMGHDPWIDPALYRIGEGEWQIVRPPATLGHVSYFALYLAVAIFVAVGLALESAGGVGKIAWASGALTMTLALLVTGSRGAWLGAAVGAVVLVIRAGPRARRAILVGSLLVVATTAIFVISPWGQPVRSRTRWFVEDPQGGSRLQLWRDSLRLSAAHPVLGVGPDNFGLAFLPVESLETAQRVRDFYVESPHNVLLDYLTTAGVLALLSFAALMVFALRNLLTQPALLAALIAGLVGAQFIADTIPTRLLLMILAALAFPAPSSNATKPVARWMIGVSATVALCFAVFFGMRLVRADRTAYQASTAARRGDLDGLLQSGRASMEAFPWCGVYAFQQSRLLGQMVMVPQLPPAARGLLFLQAEVAAQAALPHSERPHVVHLHLATLRALQGDYVNASTELERAIEASPTWFRPRWQLALLLWQQGKRQEAARQATAALERGTREHPEIAADLIKIQRATDSLPR